MYTYNYWMKRTKDLDFENSPLQKPCRFWLSTNPSGSKDVTRMLNTLMALQAPLELSREEAASVFFCVNQTMLGPLVPTASHSAITKLTSRMRGI